MLPCATYKMWFMTANGTTLKPQNTIIAVSTHSQVIHSFHHATPRRVAAIIEKENINHKYTSGKIKSTLLSSVNLEDIQVSGPCIQLPHKFRHVATIIAAKPPGNGRHSDSACFASKDRITAPAEAESNHIVLRV